MEFHSSLQRTDAPAIIKLLRKCLFSSSFTKKDYQNMFGDPVCILEDDTPKCKGKTVLLHHWGKFVRDERGRYMGTLAEEIPVEVDAWHPGLSAELFRVGETVRLKDKTKQLGKITAFRLCLASVKVGVVLYDAIVRYDGKKHSRLYSLDNLAHC